MRYENFLEKEYYMISNSGIEGVEIFKDEEDKKRFIFLITHFQSPIQIYNINWYVNRFIKKGIIAPNEPYLKRILKKRSVELLAFCILNNKFEILVKNLNEKIISVYMQRVLTGYSKYYNLKYKKRGHVFCGPFKAKKVKNQDVPITSAKIHVLPQQKTENYPIDYQKYQFSSYQDYITENRWQDFLETETILKHFEKNKYKEFVESFKDLDNF